MIRRPPRSTQSRSSAASDVYKRQLYKDLRDRTEVFDGVIARASAPVSVSDGGTSERARAELVSGNLFPVLGVQPTLGRAIAPSDDTAPGASPVVMLSAAYWKKRFGASPGIVGRKILVNAHPCLLYTSDAADDLLCVDLGGRRIIK